MRKTLVYIIAAATLSAGTIAYAQSGGGDRNADMTRAQAEERAASAFARMDVNKDGRVDQADRDARHRAHFDRLDADSNGAISYAEFTAMHEQRGERREARAEGGERRGKGHGRHGMRGGGHMMMGNADANNDGTITQAEFTAASLARFAAADADGNGTVTAEERRAQRQEHRAERQSN